MSWEAYQLDIATWTVGRWVDGKLAEHDKKGRPIHHLSDLLDQKNDNAGFGYAPWPGQVKKMAIPASGVW